jgi:hypothetical protein
VQALPLATDAPHRVTSTPRGLDGPLAARLSAPLAASGTTESPEIVQGTLPGHKPTLEATKVGMGQIAELRATVCEQLSAQIRAAGSSR